MSMAQFGDRDRWRERLVMRAEMEALADALLQR